MVKNNWGIGLLLIGLAIFFCNCLLIAQTRAYTAQDGALLKALQASDYAGIKAAVAAGASMEMGYQVSTDFGGATKTGTLHPIDFLISDTDLPTQQMVELLNLFKQKGANFRAVDYRGNTLLFNLLQYYKSGYDLVPVVKALLNNGGELKSAGQSTIPETVLRNKRIAKPTKLSLLSILAGKGVNLNDKESRNGWPLWQLVLKEFPRQDWFEYLEGLLKAGMDPNAQMAVHVSGTITEFGKASSFDYTKQVSLLNYCVNADSPFSQEEKVRLIKLLAAYKADFNLVDMGDKSGKTALAAMLSANLGEMAKPTPQNAELAQNMEELYGLMTSLGADVAKPYPGGPALVDLLWDFALPHYDRLVLDGLAKLKNPGELRIWLDDSTVLHWMVEHGKTAIVRWLIDNGASLDSLDAHGEKPLTRLSALLAWSNDPDIDAQHSATALEILSLFAARKADLNAVDRNGFTLVAALASRDSKLPVVKALVSAGADFQTATNDDQTPLAIAIEADAKNMASYLRSKGATKLHSNPVPAVNDSPLAKAILRGDQESLGGMATGDFSAISIRLSNGVPSTPLHLAVEQATPTTMAALLKRGLDWNAPDRFGRSPLTLAVILGKADLVSLLVEAGANPNLVDKGGETPLSRAISLHPEMVSSIIAKKTWDASDATMYQRVFYKALYANNLAALQNLGNILRPNYDLAASAASFGRTDFVDALLKNAPSGEKSPQQLHAESLEAAGILRGYPKGKASVQPVSIVADGLEKKRGDFSFTLKDWSPWLATKTIPPPPLKKYPVYISIPADYNPAQPWGLLISMLKPLSKNQYPSDAFRKILKERHLIWVSFDPYFGDEGIDPVFNGDSIESLAVSHEAYILAIAYAMLRHFPLDRNRIYLGGFSWGGRLTAEIVPDYPEIFKGGIAVGGCFTTGGKVLFGASMDYARTHVRMALASADYDYNRDETWNGYNAFLKMGYEAVYFQEALQNHVNISPANFAKALDFLDGKTN